MKVGDIVMSLSGARNKFDYEFPEGDCFNVNKMSRSGDLISLRIYKTDRCIGGGTLYYPKSKFKYPTVEELKTFEDKNNEIEDIILDVLKFKPLTYNSIEKILRGEVNYFVSDGVVFGVSMLDSILERMIFSRKLLRGGCYYFYKERRT